MNTSAPTNTAGRMTRKGQFFIITTILISGAVIFMSSLFLSSSDIDYTEVLSRHDTDIVENAGERVQESWWHRNWTHRTPVTVREANGTYLTDHIVPVYLPITQSQVKRNCGDIRIIDGNQSLPWNTTTGCNIDTYSSGTDAVAQYRMDEASGQWVNDSAGDNDGVRGSTLSAESRDPSWISGRYGSGLQFDGADDRVTVPDQPELDSFTRVTLMTWVRFDDVADSASQALIRKSGSYLLQKTGNNRISFAVWDGGSRVDWQTCATRTLTDADNDRWFHVAGSFNGTDYRIYLDGKPVATCPTSASSIDTSNAPVGIGAEPSSSFLDGIMDDARIYGYALSADQVRGIYENGIGLNVSMTLSPLEEKTVHVYHGNFLTDHPGYSASRLTFTPIQNQPYVSSVGTTRTQQEIKGAVDHAVDEFDSDITPSLDYVQDDCDSITFRSSLARLAWEQCPQVQEE